MFLDSLLKTSKLCGRLSEVLQLCTPTHTYAHCYFFFTVTISHLLTHYCATLTFCVTGILELGNVSFADRPGGGQTKVSLQNEQGTRQQQPHTHTHTHNKNNCNKNNSNNTIAMTVATATIDVLTLQLLMPLPVCGSVTLRHSRELLYLVLLALVSERDKVLSSCLSMLDRCVTMNNT